MRQYEITLDNMYLRSTLSPTGETDVENFKYTFFDRCKLFLLPPLFRYSDKRAVDQIFPQNQDETRLFHGLLHHGASDAPCSTFVSGEATPFSIEGNNRSIHGATSREALRLPVRLPPHSIQFWHDV